MRIETIKPLVTYINQENKLKPEGTGFADLLRQAVQDVNQTQKTADQLTEDFAIGKVNNVHEVTIATEQAQLALDLTIAVRNKVVDAYKEIMRMQF
jgi:flagellar hook-basal body complex protein FliE